MSARDEFDELLRAWSAAIVANDPVEIGRFDRHGMDMIGQEWRMIEQAFAQMREVAVGIAGRRDPLVHLHDVHVLVRQLMFGGTHRGRRTLSLDRPVGAPPVAGYKARRREHVPHRGPPLPDGDGGAAAGLLAAGRSGLPHLLELSAA